jgi:hypothetical protein
VAKTKLTIYQITLFAMLGLVSGSYARPASRSHERYIRPPR